MAKMQIDDQAVIEMEQTLDEALRDTEAVIPQAPAEPEADTDVKAELLRLLSDPDIANQAVKTALATPEGRQLLNVPLGVGAPVGDYHRNYEGEAHLRVFGGIEVGHPPGFAPLPPSYITKYEAVNGGETNHEVGQATTIGLPDQEPRRDERGRAVKTQMYKFWLDKQMKGERLDSNVQSDMAAGVFKTDGPSPFAADGTPTFDASDPGMGPTE